MTLEIALKKIQRITDEFNLETLRPQVQACERLIADTLKVDVAVFGRFKAGKSSFLNHLLSKSILPVGVVPVTAVVTRIQYGE